MFKAIGSLLKRIPLIEQIAVGLVIGIAVAVLAPGAVPFLGIFGDLFVKALKGVAPLLVFILVMNAMIQRIRLTRWQQATTSAFFPGR